VHPFGECSIVERYSTCSALYLVDFTRGIFYLSLHFLTLSPFVLERGRPVFEGLHDQLNLKLLKTKVFGSGVFLLDYQSDRKEPK
jgi:hypothetical protein